MSKFVCRAVLILVLGRTGFVRGQAPVAFEVASVKPSAAEGAAPSGSYTPGRGSGGIGSRLRAADSSTATICSLVT
jgi:hypothetical protein